MSASTTSRRRYESPRRAAQAAETRAAVLAAATELFAERGWSGTSMRDVAKHAGVAVETVYSGFGSKADLLRAAIEVAVVGDVQEVAAFDRDEFQQMGTGSLDDRARAAASLVTEVNVRTCALARAVRQAAAREESLAELARDIDELRRFDTGRGTTLMLGRPATDTERDTLWSVASPEVYELLVERSGWSRDRYEAWLAEMVTTLARREPWEVR